MRLLIHSDGSRKASLFAFLLAGLFSFSWLPLASQLTPSIQWQRAVGGSEHDVPQCIYQTRDGGYIIGGATGSKDGDVVGQHGKGDMWVVKLSADGKTIEWKRTLGGGSDDMGTLVQQTLDGGYLIGGVTSSSNGDVKG